MNEVLASLPYSADLSLKVGRLGWTEGDKKISDERCPELRQNSCQFYFMFDLKDIKLYISPKLHLRQDKTKVRLSHSVHFFGIGRYMDQKSYGFESPHRFLLVSLTTPTLLEIIFYFRYRY